MTSLAVNYNWTPELIAKDKELKEKNGASAHIIPQKTYGAKLERVPEFDSVDKKKSDSNAVANLAKGGAALTGAYAIKKSLPNIFNKAIGFFRIKEMPTSSGVMIVDNGKPLKFLRDIARNIDSTLFSGKNNISKIIQKHCPNWVQVGPTIRKAVFTAKAAKFGAIGLAIWGGYQLLKAAVSTFSNK